MIVAYIYFFFFQAEDGIRDGHVTGVQTCALPISYCQDNELTWFDWKFTRQTHVLLNFTRDLIALRRAHPVFRRRRFFQGSRLHGSAVKDIAWLRPDGKAMTEEEWTTSSLHYFGMRLTVDAINE